MTLPTRLRWCTRALPLALVAAAVLAACGGGGDDGTDIDALQSRPATLGVSLEKIGGFATGQFDVSAAEIPAFDAASQRLFVVNAQAGRVDVLDLRDPRNPVKVDELSAGGVLAGAEINSVAVANGLVAVAIQAPTKTDTGYVAIYRASDLSLLGSAPVGAQPDMVTFTPDGQTVLLANEGEPSDDYQIDPVGSISVVDISNPVTPRVRTAGFDAYIGQEAALRERGVRIYGPGANAAQDFEPEYIAVSADGTTAWATLQENNALAKIDIASATVTDILPLGYKDHAEERNAFDASDRGGAIDIKTWPGVKGMYLPDSMAAYQVKGQTYLVTANEGDARDWQGDGYIAGTGTGLLEEIRVGALLNPTGFASNTPPQLRALGAGALLNPARFTDCGTEKTAVSVTTVCSTNPLLGRLNISWTQGYQTNADGSPVLFDADGNVSSTGNRLMYDQLYAFGARSFSIRDANGQIVWDSGAEFEKFFASDECKLGSARNIPCKQYFNSGHDEGGAFDSRSDAKGPEPEGVALGQVNGRTLAFIGLERIGGVLVYDITDPRAPFRLDYLNTREEWDTDPEDLAQLSDAGDLGPEGLVFIPADQSPNGRHLLVVGNEVSGTTAVFQLNLSVGVPGRGQPR